MSVHEKDLEVTVGGKQVPLNPFVREMMRKVLLAMLSTLKGITIEGNERIQIRVESRSS